MPGVHDIAPRYQAFLSYSHQHRRTALAIQRALHRIGRAWYRRATIAVFRDDTGLSAGALEPGILRALAASEHLVLLASPAAAGSRWVAREVEWWVQNRDPERILIALLDGELGWDGDRDDFADAATAVPAPLRGAYRTEPRWVDLRPGTAPHRETLADPVFHDRIADLAATLHGCAKDELISEEVRQNRRWTRLRNAAIGALALLLVLTTVASVVAFVQLGVANRQTAVAEAGEYAARSENASDPSEALALAVEAEQRTDPPLPAARRAYAGAVRTDAALPLRAAGPPVGVAAQSPTSTAFSPDGTTLAVATGASGWELRDARTGAPLPDRSPTPAPAGDAGPAAVSVSWSPDGRRLATTDDTLQTRIWDVGSGRPVGPVLASGRQKGSSVQTGTTVAWSPRGDRVAATTADASVVLWPIGTAGGPVRIPAGATSDVAWSPDGLRLATTGWDGTVRFWDTATGRADGAPVAGPGGVTYGALAWSPDGRSLAVGGPNGAVVIGVGGAAAAPRRLSVGQGEDPWVEDLAWSPDGTRLVTARSSMIVWDAATGRRIGTPVTDVASRSQVVASRIRAVAWAPDGTTVASATIGGSLRLWQVTADPRPRPIGRTAGPIRDVSWLPDSRGVYLDGDEATELWSIDGTTAARTSVRTRTDAGSAVPSPDGSRLAGAPADDGVLTVQDARTGTELRPLRGQAGGIATIAWNPRGRYLATLDYGGTVWLWDTDVGAPVGPPMTAPGGGEITSVAWSPDGQRLATGERSGLVRIWRFSDVTPIDTIAERTTGIVVSWSPDGSRIATVDDDDTVRIVDVATHAGVRVGDLPGLAPRVDWNPSGEYLAVTGDSPIHYVDAATGTVIAALDVDTGPAGVSFSPDGTRLLVADADGRFWLVTALSETEACRRAAQALGPDAVRTLLGPDRPASVCAGADVDDRTPMPLVVAP